MADRASARIHIGGPVKREALGVLFQVIHAQGVGLAMGETLEHDQLRNEDELIAALDVDGHLVLYDAEATNGMFEELESFCRRNLIAYTRFGDGLSGMWEPEVSFYRPGDDDAATLITNSHWEPAIAASVAIDAFRALQTGNVHAALTLLKPYDEGYEIPPLEALYLE